MLEDKGAQVPYPTRSETVSQTTRPFTVSIFHDGRARPLDEQLVGDEFVCKKVCKIIAA